MTDGRLVVAAADAGFRRYLRWYPTERSGPTRIVMDSPPRRDDPRLFLDVRQRLADAYVRVPTVLAADLETGFLLLDDLGAETLLQTLLRENFAPAHTERLMNAAIDTLVTMQRRVPTTDLAPYAAAEVTRELELFSEWYLKRHLRLDLTPAEEAGWLATKAALTDVWLAQPVVFTHRDYMLRNLMTPSPGENPAVLDFQDALAGPLAYDIASLLRDAFHSWPEEQVMEWLASYYGKAHEAGLPVGEEADFIRAAELIGTQRHLKVIGIFARLNYRDGKPRYLADVPRFLGYLRTTVPRHPELAGLAGLLERLPA